MNRNPKNNEKDSSSSKPDLHSDWRLAKVDLDAFERGSPRPKRQSLASSSTNPTSSPLSLPSSSPSYRQPNHSNHSLRTSNSNDNRRTTRNSEQNDNWRSRRTETNNNNTNKLDSNLNSTTTNVKRSSQRITSNTNNTTNSSTEEDEDIDSSLSQAFSKHVSLGSNSSSWPSLSSTTPSQQQNQQNLQPNPQKTSSERPSSPLSWRKRVANSLPPTQTTLLEITLITNMTRSDAQTLKDILISLDTKPILYLPKSSITNTPPRFYISLPTATELDLVKDKLKPHAFVQSVKQSSVDTKDLIKTSGINDIITKLVINNDLNENDRTVPTTPSSITPTPPTPISSSPARKQTTTIVAHRLITGALGIRSNMNSEKKATETAKLTEARRAKEEQKKLAQKRESGNAKAWDD